MKTTIYFCWLTLILILMIAGNSIGQSSEVQKLRLQIAKETNDTIKVKLLIRLATNYSIRGDSEQLICLKKAYDLSKKTKFRYGLVYGRYYEALLLWRNGSFDEAFYKDTSCISGLDSLGVVQPKNSPLGTISALTNNTSKQIDDFRYFSSKVSYYKRHGPKENLAGCYFGIAGHYAYLGDYDKSIEFIMRSRDIYHTFDPFGYATGTGVVGYYYLLWGNLEKAQYYLESGLRDFLLLKDTSLISYIYNALGDLSQKQHVYQKALHYYYLLKQYWGKIDSEYIALDLASIAAVHLQLNAPDSAKIYLGKAVKMLQDGIQTFISSHGPVEIDFYYYLYYKASHNNHLALKSLETALKEAKSVSYLPLLLKYTNELHSFLLQKGDSLMALRYLVQYHAIQDSLNKMNTQARIASFEIEQQQQQKENEIEQLQTQKTAQGNYYLIGGAFLLIIVLAVISRIFYTRKRDKEQLTTEFKKQLAEAETKALRAQMNPHFIFNSLNSINSFVMDQKHEIASDYLIKFSKLIRLILDNSRSETISLEKELETLKLYVILESARFDNKFKCVYHVAEDVDTNSIKIPPMLLQPFVENAIWHGLMQKEGEGTITIDITISNEQITDNSEQLLRITITDDGIGREKAAELKSKSATHKSHGLKVTSQRIEMMNKLNSTGAKVNIVDLKDEQGQPRGTKVELIIPF
jgi:hypothetical protein